MIRAYAAIKAETGKLASKIYKQKRFADEWMSSWRSRGSYVVKEFVLVDPTEYEDLQEAARFLQALEACGVNDWCGFEAAQDYFNCEE